MSKPTVVRDERTEMVENASYRWGYNVLAFGLLIVITYRAFAMGESNWDLFALLILSGLVATLYQYRNQILSTHWARWAIATAVISAVVAAAVVAAMVFLR